MKSCPFEGYSMTDGYSVYMEEDGKGFTANDVFDFVLGYLEELPKNQDAMSKVDYEDVNHASMFLTAINRQIALISPREWERMSEQAERVRNRLPKVDSKFELFDHITNISSGYANSLKDR